MKIRVHVKPLMLDNPDTKWVVFVGNDLESFADDRQRYGTGIALFNLLKIKLLDFKELLND